MLVNAVKELLKDTVIQVIGDASMATYVRDVANATDAEWESGLLGAQAPLTAPTAMKILKHLAARAGAAFSIGGVGMIVHIYLSVLKRGTMSQAFTDKITDGLAADLQITNLRIDHNACQTFYSIFGGVVTENTIAAITHHWSTILPVPALRLRLTVSQASGSGLTALSVTGRAIRFYTDFNWTRVSEMYPDEWGNFTAAVQAVANNPWYGFRKDLGVVSSTKYKNISYVAKELLLKVNGESSLRSYAGWTRRAKFQGVVDTMIADYEQAKTANIMTGQAMPPLVDHQRVTDMRGLINAAPDVYA